MTDGAHEVFRHFELDFQGKVRLRATVRAAWTSTDESVLVAAKVDPRFLGDPEFPNQWQSILDKGGARKFGQANPWFGAGLYMKITRLADPAGALFVEEHVVFVEPKGWFDGANLLRSKLPLAVPPPSSLRVPPVTFTVPSLSKSAPVSNVAVPEPDLISVPWLSKSSQAPVPQEGADTATVTPP